MSDLHIPVMLDEVLQYLDPKPGFTYIDGTLGLGGHSAAILQKTEGKADLIGIDRDEKTLEITREKLREWSGFRAIHGRFSEIPQLIDKNKLNKPIGGVLLDLGISSYQLDNKEYGLTFSKAAYDEPLDMRLDPWCKVSAAEIVNKWTEKHLADLFWDIADFRKARKLAKLIVENRPIQKIGEFVELCKIANEGQGKINVSTLPFMALRIAVNDEFGEIEKGLKNILHWLEPGAKIAVISFHSGEDRLVKNIFKTFPNLSIMTDRPLSPRVTEVNKNPRSRSAKLRAACVE